MGQISRYTEHIYTFFKRTRYIFSELFSVYVKNILYKMLYYRLQ